MIIRCPQCAHIRSVVEESIPPRAEFATCPRCHLRFRFRTLAKEDTPPPTLSSQLSFEESKAQEDSAREMQYESNTYVEKAGLTEKTHSQTAQYIKQNQESQISQLTGNVQINTATEAVAKVTQLREDTANFPHTSKSSRMQPYDGEISEKEPRQRKAESNTHQQVSHKHSEQETFYTQAASSSVAAQTRKLDELGLSEEINSSPKNASPFSYGNNYTSAMGKEYTTTPEQNVDTYREQTERLSLREKIIVGERAASKEDTRSKAEASLAEANVDEELILKEETIVSRPIAVSKEVRSKKELTADDSRQEGSKSDIWEAVDLLQLKWNSKQDVSNPAQAPAEEKTQSAKAVAQTSGLLHLNSEETLVQQTSATQSEATLKAPTHELSAKNKDSSPLSEAENTRKRNFAVKIKTEREHILTGGIVKNLEEKIDYDLLLMQGSDERPIRELGVLEEYSYSSLDEQSMFIPPLPWEKNVQMGKVKAFMEALRAIMFSPRFFFASLRDNSSIVPSYLFLLLVSYIVILGSAAWMWPLKEYAGEVFHLSPLLNALPVILIFCPFVLALLQVFFGGFIQLLSYPLSPLSQSYHLACKIMAYACAPFILSLIPILGPFAAIIWSFFTFISALGVAYKLSFVKSFIGTGLLFSLLSLCVWLAFFF